MDDTAADLLPRLRVTIAPITATERATCMEDIKPILDRYGADAERVPRPALPAISATILRAHAHATSAPHADRWRRLHADDFDQGCLDALRPLGVACRDVAAALASDDAQASRAKLPVELVQGATALKARAMRYLDYHLGDVGPAGVELADIRQGTGYNDLEQDLRRVAVLIEHNAERLHGDRFHQPDDAAACRSHADAIARELATTTAAPTDWVYRLWAAVRRCYAQEVYPTAQWLYRRATSELAFYPSIYASFGRPQPTSMTKGEPDDAVPTSPTDDVAPPAQV